MKLGIIAGNRSFPVTLAQNVRKAYPHAEIVVIAFKGETSRAITHFVDRCYWIHVGQLRELKSIIKEESLTQCVFAGQISPVRIFRRHTWDSELSALIEQVKDFRPHTIFGALITYLQEDGVTFLDSTLYLKEFLAGEGALNEVVLSESCARDVAFGTDIISRYVDLDVGQTIVVKNRSVVAMESLEGTDGTIRRGSRLAGRDCTVLKFSKVNQDSRFDVPVVGMATLKLLKRRGVAALVLERDRVLILDKKRFLACARSWHIAVVGVARSGPGS